MTNTSVGQPGDKGSNESHGSDGKGNKTLGEKAQNSTPDAQSRTGGESRKNAPQLNRQNIPNSSGRK